MHSPNKGIYNYLGENLDQQSISIADRGLAYGDGCFETMRYVDSAIPLLSFHLDRLLNSCQYLQISLQQNVIEKVLSDYCRNDCCHNTEPGVIKIIVTRGEQEAGTGYKPTTHMQPTIIVQFYPREIHNWYQVPMQLITSNVTLSANPSLAGHKHLNRLDYVVAAAKTPTQKYESLLLKSPNGNIVEALHHNIFYIENNQVFTPSINEVGVKGVMRKIICQYICPQLNLPIFELDNIRDLKSVDAVFLTNAVTGITPIEKIDSKMISQSNLTQVISNALIKFISSKQKKCDV